MAASVCFKWAQQRCQTERGSNCSAVSAHHA